MNVRKNLWPLLLLPLCVFAQAERMEVTADEWCPLSCQPDSDRPGYGIEVLQAVFAQDQLEYRVVPWKRAVLYTQRGTSMAAIGGVSDLAELENLQIGEEPIGYAQDCLYVSAVSTTRYKGHADDLNGLRRVGVVLGYTYREGFWQWLNRAENKPRVFVASGDYPAALNLRKLTEGTLDAVIETSMVMEHLLKEFGQTDAIKSVGCDTAEPVYVAFGPKGTQGDERVVQFDRGLAQLRQTGKLAEILSRYGLKDWKQ